MEGLDLLHLMEIRSRYSVLNLVFFLELSDVMDNFPLTIFVFLVWHCYSLRSKSIWQFYTYSIYGQSVLSYHVLIFKVNI